MENRNEKLFVQHKLARLADNPTSIAEGTKNDVGIVRPKCKYPGDSRDVSSFQNVDTQALSDEVGSSLEKPANESLEALLCTSSGQMRFGYPPISLAYCTAASGAAPVSRGFHPQSSHLSMGHDIIKSSGNLLKALQVKSDRRDFQNAFERRFVMFDNSGSDRRMLFHPSIMNSFGALPPSSLLKVDAHDSVPSPGNHWGGKSASMMRSSFLPAACAPLPGRLFDCGYCSDPHHVVMDSMSSTSDNCHLPHFVDAERNGAEADTERYDNSPELSYFSHENTEDIEALLNSDVEEVSSTGHSPSDLSKNWSFTFRLSDNESSHLGKSMKRKRDEEDNDEVCSTATSGRKIDELFPSGNDGGCGGVEDKESSPTQGVALARTSDYRLATPVIPSGDEATPSPATDGTSSKRHAKNKRQCKKFDSSQQLGQPSVPVDLSRKEKIKNILRLLRGVIPGGECMDTAFVLDEAIQYVRTLQSEVQKLQAEKFA